MTWKVFYFTFIVCLFSLTASGQNNSTLSKEAEPFPFLAEVTSDHVNVRAGQSVNFEKLCQLKKGEEIVVIEKSYHWYKIQLPSNAQCFVSEKYMQLLDEGFGGITAEGVNIRAGTDINSTVIGQLDKGMKVSILERLDGWYKIKPVGGSYGWVQEQFLDFKSHDITTHEQQRSSGDQGIKTAEPFKAEPTAQNDQTGKGDGQGNFEQSKHISSDLTKEVAVIGTLKAASPPVSDRIQHILLVNGQPAYFIEGLNHLLDAFLNEKVSVEGKIKTDVQNQYTYPVIIVSRIQLVV